MIDLQLSNFIWPKEELPGYFDIKFKEDGFYYTRHKIQFIKFESLPGIRMVLNSGLTIWDENFFKTNSRMLIEVIPLDRFDQNIDYLNKSLDRIRTLITKITSNG